MVITTTSARSLPRVRVISNRAMTNVLGYGSSLVRPPYGATTDEIRANIEYPIVDRSNVYVVDTIKVLRPVNVEL